MCGLAGFARNPKGKGIDEAWNIFEMLMLQIRHRGTHATGIAVTQKEPFIWKKAAPVDKVLNSDPWKAVGRQVEDDATVIQGHVRWATHNNAHLDEAAHPFVEGKITGCHNGIIRNWQEIAKKLKRTDMINDSQAPFAMLDTHKNPAKALDTMDGYWALTWTKGQSLFLCKTQDASLACAYVPSMQTLFWCSEARILSATLLEAGLKRGMFDVWEVKPSTIYRYTPATFDEKGTNAEKIDAPFRGRNVKTSDRFDSAHSTVTTWKGNVATTRATTTQIPFSGGSSWDGVNARELEHHGQRVEAQTSSAAKRLTAGEFTLKNIDEKFSEMIEDMQRQIDELSGRVEVAEAESEFLRKVCDDAGLLDVVTETDADDIDAETEMLAETPGFDCDPCVNCQACGNQLGDEAFFINGEVNLSDGGECGLVHTKCLFTAGHTTANAFARLQQRFDNVRPYAPSADASGSTEADVLA